MLLYAKTTNVNKCTDWLTTKFALVCEVKSLNLTDFSVLLLNGCEKVKERYVGIPHFR